MMQIDGAAAMTGAKPPSMSVRTNTLRARRGQAVMTAAKDTLIVVPIDAGNAPIETTLTSSGALKVRTMMSVGHIERKGKVLQLGMLLALTVVAAAEADPWQYGYLVARARCGNQQVTLVSQIFGWCPADYPSRTEFSSEVFKRQHSDDVQRYMAAYCGSTTQPPWIHLLFESTRARAEERRKQDLCPRGHETIKEFYCSCEAYSSKCR
jgi:hypothetical protein